MDVDETEVAPPSSEWMEAARKAADTDGILENGPAKRQKVCNPCYTLTALNLQTEVRSCDFRVARACPERAGRTAVDILTYLLTYNRYRHRNRSVTSTGTGTGTSTG